LATDAGHYTVVVTNYGGMVTSDVANVTVFPDVTHPSIASVASLDGMTIGVRFSEEMSDANSTLHDMLNYTVSSTAGDMNPVAVVIRPGSRAVALTMGAPISGNFTVMVNENLIDVAGNTMSPSGTSRTGVVAGYFAGDVGGPALLGSHYTD